MEESGGLIMSIGSFESHITVVVTDRLSWRISGGFAIEFITLLTLVGDVVDARTRWADSFETKHRKVSEQGKPRSRVAGTLWLCDDLTVHSVSSTYTPLRSVVDRTHLCMELSSN